MTDEDLGRLITYARAMERFQVTRSTLYRALKRAGVKAYTKPGSREGFIYEREVERALGYREMPPRRRRRRKPPAED